MNEPLDELYLQWLYGNVANINQKSRRRTYWNLFRALYTIEFTWFVPNDDARVEDGRALRLEFMQELEIPEVDPDWMDLGCSFLELLIGLSRRLAFETDSLAVDWFWHLIANMELSEYNDSTRFSKNEIEHITTRISERTYERDGYGGLFPLRRPRKDQRKVELWYQMNAYVLELT